MNAFVGIQAFLLILYIVGTNGRQVEHTEYEDLPEAEEQTEILNRVKDHASQMRHRRRPRQMHGYEYTPPFFYDNRRDYSIRQQDEYLSHIVKSLDEIISYIRRPPPPPPQPIYVPYPVVQYIPCGYRVRPRPAQKVPAANGTSQTPDFTDRIQFEDENQLWGMPVDEVFEDEDEGDGSRPVNFIPIEPNRPTSRPPPPVEHGSNQAGGEQTPAVPSRRPGTCEAAILTCCTLQDTKTQRNCFARYNCLKTYSTNRACDPSVLKKVLENFSNAYAPVRN